MAVNRRNFLKSCAAGAGAALVGAHEGVAKSLASHAFDDCYAMLNDGTKCVGCRGCQNACHDYYGLTPKTEKNSLYDMPDGLEDSHYTIIQLHKEAERHEFVKKQCMHCNYPSCASACPVAALKKQDDGPVTYDKDKCIGCRYCMVACPFNVPRFEYYTATPEIKKCTFCHDRLKQGQQPICVDTCPTGAIKFGKRFELLAEGKQRIQAEPAKYMSHVYGEEETGGTSVMYLAGTPFSSLGLKPFDDDPPAQLAEQVQHGIFKWFVTPIALFGLLGLARVAYMKNPEEDDVEETREEH